MCRWHKKCWICHGSISVSRSNTAEMTEGRTPWWKAVIQEATGGALTSPLCVRISLWRGKPRAPLLKAACHREKRLQSHMSFMLQTSDILDGANCNVGMKYKHLPRNEIHQFTVHIFYVAKGSPHVFTMTRCLFGQSCKLIMNICNADRRTHSKMLFYYKDGEGAEWRLTYRCTSRHYHWLLTLLSFYFLTHLSYYFSLNALFNKLTVDHWAAEKQIVL